LNTRVSILMILPQGLTVTGVTTWALSLTESLSSLGVPCGALIHGCASGFSEVESPFAPGVRVFHPDGLPRIEQAGGAVEPFARAYADAAAQMAGTDGVVCLVPMRHGDCFGACARVTQILGDRVRLIGWQQNDSAYEDAVIQRYAPACAALVGVSDHLHRRHSERYGSGGAHVRRIWNGVRVPEACPHRPGPVGCPLELVYTGRLEHEQKRIGALIAMSDALERTGIAHRVTIAGDGPAMPEMRRAADSRSHRITLTGSVDARTIGTILDRADVFVLASRMEGLSYSMLEAMAHGCAIVAMRTESGAPEAITDGVTGVLVEAEPGADAHTVGASLARGISRAVGLGIPKLGSAAWARARDRFSLERQARETGILLRACAALPARIWPTDRSCAFSAPPGTSAESGSVPADGAARTSATLAALRDRRIAIHGVGAHTHQLIHLFAPHADHIACFTDDNPSAWGTRLLDRPVVSPREAAALGATDVMISSWMHERTVWENRGVYDRQGLRVHRIYGADTRARAPRSTRARKPVVVSVHGADVTSGVTTWAARMCARANAALDWKMVIAGPRAAVHDARATWPGSNLGHAHFVSWSEDARATDRIEIVRAALADMGAAAVVGNYVPEAYAAGVVRGIGVVGVAHAQHEWYREVLGRASGVIDAWWAVSCGAQDRVSEILRALPTCDPIPCGVPIGPLEPRADGDKVRPMRIVFAGRLENIEKRAMDLVPLCDALHESSAPFEMRIAGTGPGDSMVRDGLAVHIKRGRVRMEGAVQAEAMGELYRWADVVVLVSRREGMPVVVMEALAHGCAVAITEGCGDAVGIVREHACGIVVPVGAMGAMAKALSESRGELPAMGARGREIAERHFDITTIGARCDAMVAGAIERATATTAISTDAWRSVLALVELVGDATPNELETLAQHARRAIGDRTFALPGLWRMEERVMREALARARSAGLSRLAIFPGGRHTARIGRALRDAGEVVAIIDERANAPGGPSGDIHGRIVVTPAEALALGIDGVIVSSDQHESALCARARTWGIPVVTLYAEPDSLPAPTRDAAA